MLDDPLYVTPEARRVDLVRADEVEGVYNSPSRHSPPAPMPPMQSALPPGQVGQHGREVLEELGC